MIGRRSFITGLVSLVAAPAIVRYSNLMPVKSMLLDDGAALNSIAHPFNNWAATADLTENSLIQFALELKKSFELANFQGYLRSNAGGYEYND